MHYAIVGGGFSGLLAAYELEKKGQQVTVYEKEELLGGHCRTLLNKDLYGEIGTVFSFPDPMKELLIELDVEYTRRFTYRNFLDENFSKSEHVSFDQVQLIMKDLKQLKSLMETHYPTVETLNYDRIPGDLLQPLDQFLSAKGLHRIRSLIAPLLSSFGFGCTSEIPAYYALNIFTVETILSFMKGEKLLFVNKGTSEIIKKLSENISDIRYSMEVTGIEKKDGKVLVETPYREELYDRVLISAKLPPGVLKDGFYARAMESLRTHPYFTCAYEIEDQRVVTTYFKPHLGMKEKIQFFHVFKQNNKCLLIAYSYGCSSPQLVSRITGDIEKSGVNIKRLITVKQWEIFPHIPGDRLQETSYTDIFEQQKKEPIKFIGSLVSKPSISNLYASVKHEVEHGF